MVSAHGPCLRSGEVWEHILKARFVNALHIYLPEYGGSGIRRVRTDEGAVSLATTSSTNCLKQSYYYVYRTSK
jgi:hypothetical protein